MKEWEVLSEQCVYRREPWLTLYEQEVRLPNGVVLPHYILAEVPEVVMIFPVTDTGDVVLVEQYKHGLRRCVWDLPAGYIDPGEEPLAAAKRELEEETGHIGGEWEHLASLFFDENRHGKRFHYYLAKGVRAAGAQSFDESEDIMVRLAPLPRILDTLADGRVCSAHSTVGIYRGLDQLGRLQHAQ